MNAFKLVLPWLGAALVFACGGGIAEDGGGDASIGADARLDAPTSEDGGEMSCDQARALIDAFRARLQGCCPECNSLQCGAVTVDICCPITVNKPSPEFERAVSEFKRHCDAMCPAITCPSVPSNICDPDRRTCL